MAVAEHDLSYEPLDYDPRYYIQTAKTSISSVGHVIAEAVSNADEAISRRAKRDDADDVGEIRIAYDPETTIMIMADDGIGMTSAEMLERLKKVGAAALEDSKRGFFHRGLRDVFIAMGTSTVESVALKDGKAVYSKAVFDQRKGMAIAAADEAVTDEVRDRLRLSSTGTVVKVPLKPLASARPRLFEFGPLSTQIMNCVQVRPVLSDPNRKIMFEYDATPARRLEFRYPNGDSLLAETEVAVAGLKGSLWAKAADEPLSGSFGSSKQTRRYGILIRGERAAYEVTLGEKLRMNPAMQRVFGELRLDGIEDLQRKADEQADDEAQLIYKADRSGLNPDHELVDEIGGVP